ncbi:hypothetical protein DPM13_01365 [Paracoccus mutanolyticus]|uniref:Uncharacterized protein n=1 Tax=Paracoccus mutanolyticus TaxID=1499308 RepID=A0ABM6WNZ9_9RHOB|nr:hypothetical protein DPM13_01365 [Paracoccus mutanolyticus]
MPLGGLVGQQLADLVRARRSGLRSRPRRHAALPLRQKQSRQRPVGDVQPVVIALAGPSRRLASSIALRLFCVGCLTAGSGLRPTYRIAAADPAEGSFERSSNSFSRSCDTRL